jgi:hypothetical protein
MHGHDSVAALPHPLPEADAAAAHACGHGSRPSLQHFRHIVFAICVLIGHILLLIEIHFPMFFPYVLSDFIIIILSAYDVCILYLYSPLC